MEGAEPSTARRGADGCLGVVRYFEAAHMGVAEIPWEHREVAHDLICGRGRAWLEKKVAARGKDISPARVARAGRPVAPVVRSLLNAAARGHADLGAVRLSRADPFELLWWARRLGITHHDLDLGPAGSRARDTASALLSTGYFRKIEGRRASSETVVRGPLRAASEALREELGRLQNRLPQRGAGNPVLRSGVFTDEDLGTLRELYTEEELKSWRSLYTEEETREVWRVSRTHYRLRALAQRVAPEIKEPEAD